MNGPPGPEPPESADPSGSYRYGPRGEREVIKRGWGPVARAPSAPPGVEPDVSQAPPPPPPPPPPPETGTYIPPGPMPPGYPPTGPGGYPPYGAPPPGPEGYPPYGAQPPGAPPPARPRPGPRGRNPWVVPIVIGVVALVLLLVRQHHISTDTVIIFCCLIPSIILHEISHGWVALAFGDDTAKRAGRLTLNPLAHIDPVGTIVVPALMALSGIGFFGWAKPVPVNVGRLRSPRNQTVIVSLAGPATNIVLAAIAALVIKVGHPTSFNVLRVFFYLGLVNLGLAVFNLIPIPPLDGSAVVERMLPLKWWPGYLRLRQYTMPLVLLLVMLNYYLNPGPITWLYDHIANWWVSFLGLH